MMQATFHDKTGKQTPTKNYMLKIRSDGLMSDSTPTHRRKNKMIPDHEKFPPPRAILGGGRISDSPDNSDKFYSNNIKFSEETFPTTDEKALSGLYEKPPM
jgi:hypothetical protein